MLWISEYPGYNTCMAHYTNELVDKSAQELAAITQLPPADTLALNIYNRLLVEQVTHDSKSGRARGALFLALKDIEPSEVAVTQLSSGLFISNVTNRFSELMPYSADLVFDESYQSDIRTGVEKAQVRIQSIRFSPLIRGLRALNVLAASTPDAHYLELPEWMIELTDVVESKGIELDREVQIPISLTEAKNTSY